MQEVNCRFYNNPLNFTLLTTTGAVNISTPRVALTLYYRLSGRRGQFIETSWQFVKNARQTDSYIDDGCLLGYSAVMGDDGGSKGL
jgi:hypothetical protein